MAFTAFKKAFMAFNQAFIAFKAFLAFMAFKPFGGKILQSQRPAMKAFKAVQLMTFMAMADWLVDWIQFSKDF